MRFIRKHYLWCYCMLAFISLVASNLIKYAGIRHNTSYGFPYTYRMIIDHINFILKKEDWQEIGHSDFINTDMLCTNIAIFSVAIIIVPAFFYSVSIIINNWTNIRNICMYNINNPFKKGKANEKSNA